MQTTPLSADTTATILPALARSDLLRDLAAEQLRQVASHGSLCVLEDGEVLVEQGAASDAFFVIVEGSLSIRVAAAGGPPVEMAALPPGAAIGEVGMLLGSPRGATAVAVGPTQAVRFEARVFQALIQKIPAFALGLSRMLAERLASASARAGTAEERRPDATTVEMLPLALLQRHQMLPMAVEGNVLTVGFVQEPTAAALAAVRLNAPGMSLRTVPVSRALFEEVVGVRVGAAGWESEQESPVQAPAAAGSPRLDALLRRMVAEGASDLHLSGGQRPRWRVDGEIHELADAPRLGPEEVLALVAPILPERNRAEFAETSDTDFAYALAGTARFRTNLFRDHGGVGAVMRQIPDRILSVEQLGLPAAAQALCDQPKGLVLVTGPTGSGKSTTLAAMIDHINRTRKAHIVTLEDPIEFVHESRIALVNQREVGPHTRSFGRALRAALREDPDIVLVGELRDLETVSLALETANTGHLVFGTLHTATAMSTVDRIVNLFPPEQQAQVRASLADVLRGVLAQTLCRRIGGGRVAALEVLVSSPAIANLIREGKTAQLATAMMTGRANGNQTLNEELARLVLARKVEAEEALSKSLDRGELQRRLGT